MDWRAADARSPAQELPWRLTLHLSGFPEKVGSPDPLSLSLPARFGTLSLPPSPSPSPTLSLSRALAMILGNLSGISLAEIACLSVSGISLSLNLCVSDSSLLHSLLLEFFPPSFTPLPPSPHLACPGVCVPETIPRLLAAGGEERGGGGLAKGEEGRVRRD